MKLSNNDVNVLHEADTSSTCFKAELQTDQQSTAVSLYADSVQDTRF